MLPAFSCCCNNTARLEALGGPEAVGGLVDLLAFASTCRGASEEEVRPRVRCLSVFEKALLGACRGPRQYSNVI